MRWRMTEADGMVAGACLLVALAFFLLPLLVAREGAVLTVRHLDTGKTEEYRLSEDRTLHLEGNGYILTVEIRDGAARVVASDCPDGTCRLRGAIRRGGETLVCAPAGVVLTVRTRQGGEIDAVAG